MKQQIYLRCLLLVGLLLGLASSLALAQTDEENLLINGDFEEGFQTEFGLGYAWGGFSNGNAVVGWNADSWEAVVVEGQYSQLLQIEDALEEDRYAGIYQTVTVVPEAQYQLTLHGLIRSEEGSAELSYEGYQLQYGVDYEGGAGWESVDNWADIGWKEQSLYQPAGDQTDYTFETFETTLTAKTDSLTLFIRGWKREADDSAVVFNLDNIRLVGPLSNSDETLISTQSMQISHDSEAVETDSPTTIMESPKAETSADLDALLAEDSSSSDMAREAETVIEVDTTDETTTESTADLLAESTTDEIESEPSTTTVDLVEETVVEESATQVETVPEINTVEEIAVETVTQQTAPNQSTASRPAQLPVSGEGSEQTLIYMVGFGLMMLVLLFVGVVLMMRRRQF